MSLYIRKKDTASGSVLLLFQKTFENKFKKMCGNPVKIHKLFVDIQKKL